MTYTASSSTRNVLDSMAPTRRDILVDLKMHQGGTVEDLAEHLHLSPGAVRHQLALLTAEGFVRFEGVPRDGRGRRPRDYQLTRRGDELFPNASEEIAIRLLSRIRRQSPDALARAVTAELDELRQSVSFAVQGRTFDERLSEIVAVFEERNFFPSVERDEDGALLLCTNHSPAFAVSEALPDTFDMESAIVQLGFPEATIETLEHRSKGDGRCVFRITQSRARR